MPFDQILAKVGALILQAVPTLIIVIVLHFYLKSMLFKPLAKVLAERDTLTKGARDRAEASLKLAEEKAAQYEKAIRDARNELYKEQEAMRKQWLSDQTAQVERARASSDAIVKSARETLAKDAEDARRSLAAEAGQMADKIVSSILG